jgi:hypothetical protein
MKRLVMLFFIISLTMNCNKKSNEVELIKKIDHIIFNTDRSLELYNLLLNKFDLPLVVYSIGPWEYTNWGNFSSGGFNLGNVNLEVAYFKDNTYFGIMGIAFEPILKIQDTEEELDNRQIEHSDPVSSNTLWTTLGIKNMLTNSDIFFCEYHFSRDTSYKYPGGAIDIESVLEINLSTKNLDVSINRWNTLLSPIKEKSTGYWEIGNGPAIRINEGNVDQIESLKIKVKSLEKTKLFLEENDLLGEISENTISTDPKKCFGMIFIFSELN